MFRREGRDTLAATCSVIDGYIYGLALQQANLPIQTSEEVLKVAQHILRQRPADEFPHPAEMIERAMKPCYEYADEFEFGLDLILHGLARLRGAA